MTVYVLTSNELGWDCVIAVALSIKGLYDDYYGEDEEYDPDLKDAEIYRTFKQSGQLHVHEKELIE